MIDVVAVVLAAIVLLALGVVVYLVYRNTALADQLLAARDNAQTNAVTAERARFEADQATKALADARARADALTEFISHDAHETDASAPLDPGDVNGRVLRIARAWSQAGVPSDAGKGGAAAGDGVHPDSGTSSTAAHVPGK